jgi:hypothetical protein
MAVGEQLPRQRAPRHGQVEVVDRRLAAATGIFDRTANQAGCGGAQDRLRTVLGQIAKAVFQVCRHRQRRGIHDGLGIARVSSRLRAPSASAPQAEGRPALVVASASKPRAANILAEPHPRVGDDECAIAFMQRLEGFGSQGLHIHGSTSGR